MRKQLKAIYIGRWWNFLAQQKRTKKFSKMIVLRWQKTWLCMVFENWVERLKDQLHLKRLIKKCILRMKNRVLAAIMDTWIINSDYQRQLQLVKDSAVARRPRTTAHTVLNRCFLWEENRKERLEWRGRIDRDPPPPISRNQIEDWAAFVGDMANLEKGDSRILRFFVSSTFDDTLYERNFILEDVIPYIKECARCRGLDVALSEMRFGIRDSASSDNRTSEICMEELKHCQEVSAGIDYILISSDKYGFRPCPYRITKFQFDSLLDHMSEEEAQIVLGCYRLDENPHETPEFIMKSQDEIPNFWQETFQQLQKAFREAAKRLWPDKVDELRNPHRCEALPRDYDPPVQTRLIGRDAVIPCLAHS
jgi:hypothetical protein